MTRLLPFTLEKWQVYTSSNGAADHTLSICCPMVMCQADAKRGTALPSFRSTSFSSALSLTEHPLLHQSRSACADYKVDRFTLWSLEFSKKAPFPIPTTSVTLEDSLLSTLDKIEINPDHYPNILRLALNLRLKWKSRRPQQAKRG